MADYQLTQTGQEVQDILDSLGATYFFSQVCSTWASDSTYPDYPYKGTIPLVGIDGTMGVEVSFGNAEAISGDYSPICNTVNDAVEIWSKVNNTITIPTIKIYKNGYVNLSGSSNYMPQSGGNFTGAISVNTDPVVTDTVLANAFAVEDFSNLVTFTETPYIKSFTKSGRTVCIDWMGAAATHAQSDVLCTIPEAYRPRVTQHVPFTVNALGVGNIHIIANSGQMLINQIQSAATANGRIYFNCSYQI